MTRNLLLPMVLVLVLGTSVPAQANPGPLFEAEGTMVFSDGWAGIDCHTASALLTVDATARVATFVLTFPSECAVAQAWYLQALGTNGVVFALAFGSWEEGFTGISGAHVLYIAPPAADGSITAGASYFWPIAEPMYGGGILQPVPLD